MQSYNREYRSSIFAMLFQDRKELLQLEKCQTLSEYSEFVARMQEVILKRGLSEGEQKACIEEVIDRCIEENILRDFLTKHREAVIVYSRCNNSLQPEALVAEGVRKSMFCDAARPFAEQNLYDGPRNCSETKGFGTVTSRLAYDEEAHMAAIREDSYDDGYDNGQTDKTLDAARKMMKKLKLTAKEALDILDVPEEEQSDYLQRLESNTNEGESAELCAHDTAN